MNKRSILAIATLLVFGLSAVAFAFTHTNGSTNTAMSCCKGDSCPMKKKDASATGTAKSCDDCDCCGDSCPMKKGDASATAMKMDGAESCPMMKKNASGKNSAACCAGCDCCNASTEKVESYYRKGVAHSEAAKSNCKCCDAKKDVKTT